MPEFGEHVAIDGSDLPAYANGQRFVSKGGRLRVRFSDPDASWGHRSAISTRKGGGYYGYKLHAAVCTTTGLPVAWETHTAKDAEVPVVPSLLDKIADYGITPAVCIADKGYDAGSFYEACEARNVRPVAPLRQTRKVAAGEHLPPTCEHGTWTFAGSDAKRGAAKYRCPSGECSPASVWIKADRLHTLIPRETARWKALYRSRAAVERVRAGEARMGAAAPSGTKDRAGAATRRPDDPISAGRGARQGPSRSPRRVAPACSQVLTRRG